MKSFAIYTGARVGLFLGAFGVVWLIIFHWVAWSASSVLWTALVAMVVSMAMSLVVLRGLREKLSTEIAARADRAKAAFDAQRAVEDDDEDEDRPGSPAAQHPAVGSGGGRQQEADKQAG